MNTSLLILTAATFAQAGGAWDCVSIDQRKYSYGARTVGGQSGTYNEIFKVHLQYEEEDCVKKMSASGHEYEECPWTSGGPRDPPPTYYHYAGDYLDEHMLFLGGSREWFGLPPAGDPF